MKKVGLFISTFNRPDYLKQTILSLESSDLSQLFTIVIVDDCSTDKNTLALLNNPLLEKPIFNKTNLGLNKTSKIGFDQLVTLGCDILINLDSDVIVSPNWLNVLLNLSNSFPNNIISGFDTASHPITSSFPSYVTKSSIGGINMLFSRELYLSSVVKAFTNLSDWWDQNLTKFKFYKLPFIVSKPSVVQHMGIVSSLGNYHKDGSVDQAIDFPK